MTARRGTVVCDRGVRDGCSSVGRTAPMSTPAAVMTAPSTMMAAPTGVMAPAAVASTVTTAVTTAVTSFGLGQAGR